LARGRMLLLLRCLQSHETHTGATPAML
jgi:hypothetical protein